jgi:hypothetical protein
VSIIFVKNVGVRKMRRNEIFVPENVMNEALEAVGKVVPVKSKILYEKGYNCLCIGEIRRTPGGRREDKFGLYFGAIKICKIILIVGIPFTADENVID